jgi:hypothetical protein
VGWGEDEGASGYEFGTEFVRRFPAPLFGSQVDVIRRSVPLFDLALRAGVNSCTRRERERSSFSRNGGLGGAGSCNGAMWYLPWRAHTAHTHVPDISRWRVFFNYIYISIYEGQGNLGLNMLLARS